MGALRVMELHAPVKVVQRSTGRTATAAAAYRAAERVECERTGQIHDYTKKRGVEATALLVPDQAPAWAHDRQKLWNAAEMREKHPRAQTAREVEVALPSEFTPEERRQAGLKIGQWIVARYGTAADLCWHEPPRNGDQRNHHVHILFTTRRFENGEWSKTKDRRLDDLKQGPEEIKAMRGAIAGVLNDIAARENRQVYVEHLSFEKRGLDREATNHLGPTASAIERKGQASSIGDENRKIERRNAQREKAHQDRKIVNIEEAREKIAAQQEAARREQDRRAEARDAQNLQTASRKEEAANALPLRKAPTREEVSPVITYHPAAWTPFYADAHKRRQEMLDEQDRLYKAREDELKKQMAGLHQSIDNRNIFARFWRRMTGKTAAEQAELARATTAFDEIQEKKRIASEAFENDRQRRMQTMKEEYRQREAEMYERQLAEKAQAEESEDQRAERIRAEREKAEASRARDLEQEAYRKYAAQQGVRAEAAPGHDEADASPAPQPEPAPELSQEPSDFNAASAGMDAAEAAAKRHREIQELTRKLEGPKRGMGM
jgi:hypothetical protein